MNLISSLESEFSSSSKLLDPRRPAHLQEKIVFTGADEVVDQHRAQIEVFGEEYGKAVGEAEGRISLMTKLLEAKFGELSKVVCGLIRGADESQVNDWVIRAIDPPALDAVINGVEED